VHITLLINVETLIVVILKKKNLVQLGILKNLLLVEKWYFYV